MKWARVTKANPCVVCRHTSWCCVSESWVLCMRVASDMPSKGQAGGWLHRVGDAVPKPVVRVEPERPHINATALMRAWMSETGRTQTDLFAQKLGVSFAALVSLGIAWAQEHRAWAFPMKDEYGNTIGIRLRSERGEKWAVRGSRAGLFYGGEPSGIVYVLEGPTDTAAAMTIGLVAVGRPSCQGQEEMIVARLKQATRVVIVADNDSPGWTGAMRLQGMLRVPSITWAPPQKDFREFVRQGGNVALLQALTAPLLWAQPRATNHDRQRIIA